MPRPPSNTFHDHTSPHATPYPPSNAIPTKIEYLIVVLGDRVLVDPLQVIHEGAGEILVTLVEEAAQVDSTTYISQLINNNNNNNNSTAT